MKQTFIMVLTWIALMLAIVQYHDGNYVFMVLDIACAAYNIWWLKTKG